MELLSSIESAQYGILGLWLILGAAVFFRAVYQVARTGGKVSAVEFGPRDLLLCCGFIIWFGASIEKGFGQPQPDVDRAGIVQSAVLFVGIVGFIWAYLGLRGINPLRQFGILRNPAACFGMAAGFLFAIYPLVLLAGKLTDMALHGNGKPQNIVEFFQNASETSDRGTVILTMVMAGVLAPVVEETIFRGFIYGVLKRYTGPLAAAVFSAALFAGMHLSASALPALFVLALCLTLAYEASGSLLVNIFMHAIFNCWNLLLVLWVARHPGSP